ncbi:HIT domain-containing protein [Pseudahrensia aquimaris]|uniref:HIT domain-containing protein n=1 Tax=Pseudahrensia aquimaris TaxID=744461 RepID=A0ABW3FF12_9HYPH
MSDVDKTWALDPRLETDSLALTSLELCDVRLANDARWPWLILVPRVANAEELFDLRPGQREAAMQEATMVGEKLKAVTSCEKINIAAIGNVVRQLHIHVAARATGDENWPRPIWGHGTAQPYEAGHGQALIAHLRSIL